LRAPSRNAFFATSFRRDITVRAVIVLPANQDLAVDKLSDDHPCDPVYGNAIPRTWHWLQSIADENFVDFGINSMAAELQALREAKGDDALASMLSPTVNAPVLLPAYLDCWVQTNPAPAADPNIALFLHGPERDMAEVQVCWRADLPEEFREETWIEILSLCPPTSAECLPVPVHAFRAWISGQSRFEDPSGDVEESVEVPDRKESAETVSAALRLSATLSLSHSVPRLPLETRRGRRLSDGHRTRFLLSRVLLGAYGTALLRRSDEPVVDWRSDAIRFT
jgi:hypothetical protein